MNKKRRMALLLCLLLIFCMGISTTAYAAGDVASAIEGTWNNASEQIKTLL